MKNFIKNNLKVFVAVVISGIIFGGIGVYAASQYFAKDINFTPNNENFKKEDGTAITNVEDALNELYSNSKEHNIINYVRSSETNNNSNVVINGNIKVDFDGKIVIFATGHNGQININGFSYFIKKNNTTLLPNYVNSDQQWTRILSWEFEVKKDDTIDYEFKTNVNSGTRSISVNVDLIY